MRTAPEAKQQQQQKCTDMTSTHNKQAVSTWCTGRSVDRRADSRRCLSAAFSEFIQPQQAAARDEVRRRLEKEGTDCAGRLLPYGWHSQVLAPRHRIYSNGDVERERLYAIYLS